MDQRSIVLYAVRTGLAAMVIDEHLTGTLEAEAASYPSVMRYLRKAKFVTSNPVVTLSG
jgi:hypothetical protein